MKNSERLGANCFRAFDFWVYGNGMGQPWERRSGLAVLILLAVALGIVGLVSLVVMLLQPATEPPTGLPLKTVAASPKAQKGQAKNESASPPLAGQEKYFASLKVEPAEEKLPSFSIQGKEFTVVVHKERIVWPTEAGHKFNVDDDQTDRSFEVRDAAGLVAYKHVIGENTKEGELAEIRKQGRFSFSDGVFASRIQGEKNQALVVGSGTTPSAPDACNQFVVLGLFDGKLAPFTEPFCEDVATMEQQSAERTWKLKKDGNFEVFEIRRNNAGFFRVRIPIRVDFLMAKLLPARWCIRMGAPATLAEHCEFPVEAERTPQKEDSFVRLFPSAEEGATPKHVVVKPNSKIEFLAALAPNSMIATAYGKTIPVASCSG